MNKKLKYLTKVSLNKKIKSKWFLIVNILIVIAIVSLVNIDSIINFFGGSFGKDTNIIVVDNTDRSFQLFENAMENTNDIISGFDTSKLVVTINDEEEAAIEKIEDNKTIVVVLNEDEENVIAAKIITEKYIDAVLHQKIIASINVVRSSLVISDYDINVEDLIKINTPAEIERVYLDETKTQSEEHMSIIMSVVFPTLILPFFMLIIFLVQMIGAEINEEKTTRGMEIIISNVSPKTHFISKMLASNIFVLIQGTILFLAGMLGLLVRTKFNKTVTGILPEGVNISGLWEQLVESGVADKLIYIIPLTLLLIVLSFVAYSLLAGILASMTTSMEDFQQLQTPIIIISVAGYYLAMLAPLFEGAIFIRLAAYLPFLSSLLCPALLIIGQIGIIDVFIAILLLVILIYLMITYGLKIYKVGILNYSTSKLWLKMIKAVKE